MPFPSKRRVQDDVQRVARVRLWLAVPVIVVMVMFAIYYASIPIIGPHYARVCWRGDSGSAPHCEFWDVGTTGILWLAHKLDEHDGTVAALAAVAVAWFTAILYVATDRLWRVSRDEFEATHRPRIRVRNINVRQFGLTRVTAAGRIRNPSIDDPFSGQMYVSNIGDGDARIADGYLTFFAAKYPLPMERPYEGKNGNLLPAGPHKTWIRPGESFPLLFDQPLESQDRKPEPDSFISEREVAIYAMGWVEYEDRRGRVLRTSFCRRYDPDLWRFMPFAEAVPDYEAEE